MVVEVAILNQGFVEVLVDLVDVTIGFATGLEVRLFFFAGSF
jgi:hypothetical protein